MKPTQPGWYWYRASREDLSPADMSPCGDWLIYLVRPFGMYGILHAYSHGQRTRIVPEMTGEFRGPIEPPEDNMKVEVSVKDSPQVIAMLERAQAALEAMRKTGDKMAAALKEIEKFIEELEQGGFLQDGVMMSRPAREYVAGRLYVMLHRDELQAAAQGKKNAHHVPA